MTLSGENNSFHSFHIEARGGQWWGWLDIAVVEGRATITVDTGTAEAQTIDLTRIQTMELGRWLTDQAPVRDLRCECIYCQTGSAPCPWGGRYVAKR